MPIVIRYFLAATRFIFIVSGTTAIWACAAVWSTAAHAARRQERRALAFQMWARYVLWVMGVDVRVAGALAGEPHLLVSNHLSYVDILVLASTGEVTFVAKHDVASWPVVGSMCRFVDTGFVRRSRGSAINDALDAIVRVLVSRRTVVLFPEGTSSDGRDVLPFYSPLLEAARRSGRPLGWAALAYDTPARPGSEAETVCWWGDMTLAGHFWRLLQLPAIEADVTFGELTEPGDDRKAIAADLRAAIVAARRSEGQRKSLPAAAYNQGLNGRHRHRNPHHSSAPRGQRHLLDVGARRSRLEEDPPAAAG